MENKTLSPQEALRALADGQKLTCRAWTAGEFVHLENGRFRDEGGMELDISPVTNFTIYTEPKSKRKVAPYYVEYDHGSFVLEVKCFETDEQAKKYFETESVTRCMVLEREF